MLLASTRGPWSLRHLLRSLVVPVTHKSSSPQFLEFLPKSPCNSTTDLDKSQLLDFLDPLRLSSTLLTLTADLLLLAAIYCLLRQSSTPFPVLPSHLRSCLVSWCAAPRRSDHLGSNAQQPPPGFPRPVMMPPRLNLHLTVCAHFGNFPSPP